MKVICNPLLVIVTVHIFNHLKSFKNSTYSMYIFFVIQFSPLKYIVNIFPYHL